MSGPMNTGVNAQAQGRRRAMLRTAMGPVIAAALADPLVIEIGTGAMRAIGISLPIWGLWMSSAGAVRGSGDTRSPMIRGVIAVWAAVFLAWLGVHFFDQSIAWIWGTLMITGLLPAFGNWRTFRQRAERLDREFRLDDALAAERIA